METTPDPRCVSIKRVTPFLLSLLLASTLLEGCYAAAESPFSPAYEVNNASTSNNQPTGTLEILSDPSGAEWFVDHRSQGKTPGKLTDIPPGLHKITIKKTGFREWNVSAQINPNETIRLSAPLKSTEQKPTTKPTATQTTLPTTKQPTETIQAIAKSAENDLIGKRFTMPQGANALEKYQKILSMEPKSHLGWDGLNQIVTSFQRLSKEAKKAGQHKLAALRAQKARRIQTLIEQLQKNTPAVRHAPIDQPSQPAPITEKSAINQKKTALPTPTDKKPLTKKSVPPKPKPVKKYSTNNKPVETTLTPNDKTATESPKPIDSAQLKSTTSDQQPTIPTASPLKKMDKPIPPAPDTTPPSVTPENQNNWRTQVEPVTGIEFVEIPAGCYQMGSTANDPDEQPVHEVCLQSFWLGRTEVTNGQYRRFNAKHDSTSYAGRNLNGDLQPVVNITWEDANKFARWMSGRGGVNFRLPTEAEWEYAARGGSSTTFPWGNDANEGCRYANIGDETAKKEWPKWNVFACTDGYAETAPVGMFLPNAFGLYDMIGNVWEWVSDWYSPSYYTTTATKESLKGPVEGFFRSARGGSWAVWPDYARTANRTGIDPDHPDLHVGFRLLMIP